MPTTRCRAADRHCTKAATVKKIDPTKKVTPMPGRGAEAHCDTKAARAKHSEPTAKSTPIHHEARSGRHQTP
jgi:hypothetical protein